MMNSATRRPRTGFRAKSTRVLGLVGMLSLMACGGAETAATPPSAEGTRSELATHKVQLTSEQAQQLEQRGVVLQNTKDYGSFKVIEVDTKALEQLPEGAQLRDDFNDVLLNAGTIDTQSKHGQSLRGMKLQASGKRFHIVQFAGPIQPQWVKNLEATGVKLVSYIPNNAYIVYGDVAALTSLQRHMSATRDIQWNADYLDDFKLDPSIHTVSTKAYTIQLIKDDEANTATLALIRGKQSRDGIIRETLGYVNVAAFLTVKDLYEIATRPDVLSIQPRPEMKKLDERQDMIIAGQLTGTQPTGPGYLAWLDSKGFTQAKFTASGFGVDVSDSGLDNGTPAPNHFGLYVGGNVTGTSRVVYNRLEGIPNDGSTIQGCDGHGTLNSHIIGGYSNKTAAPFTDATGFTHGLGVAPFVRVGSSVLFDPDTFTDPIYEDLQSRAYRDGMRISSNSWGANSNTYSADSQAYDALVRDAQPAGSAVEALGNQEMVIVFAAGNNGALGANTVGTPGTAKNVITAGASENVRAFGAADLCGINDTGADSAMDMIGFSGRGPASDGRKKPDLVAPGTHVSGGVAQTDGQRSNPPASALGSALGCFDASGVCAGPGIDFYPAGQQWYTASSGTSHSTPAIAGGAALVRQYFINEGMPAPSAAMTKAYLMNSTRYMTGVSANDNLFSNVQGMGLMDLDRAFDGTKRLLDDQTAANLLTATGQVRTFSGVVADTTKPFRVTLGWTDAPGSTTGSAWKNNLDLTIALGGTTYKGNVFTKDASTTGGTADGANNVESVFLPAGTEGIYTVTVTASNINSDGVPGNASALDQDFALVAYNSCTTAGVMPTGVSATVGGLNHVDVAWSENGAASYNIYRATTAGGPYTRIGSATTSPYVDLDVSGGTTYYYVVRGVNCGESAKSSESSVTATGECRLNPVFAGLTSASNGAAATCANTLTWSAGTAACGGALSYSVYRSPTPGFTPSIATKIATGVTGTSFLDDLNLATATPYYYVVRATEVSNATNEEKNTVEKSAVPTGAITPGVRYFDDLDTNRPADAAAYWMASAPTINLVSGCHYQSATLSYRFGAATTTCGGSYPVNQDASLILGGDGTTAGIDGFMIPATSLGPQLTFNLWYSLENRYDGAWLAYSTTGAAGPWTTVPDTASSTEPYISAGIYDNSLDSDSTQSIWTNTSQGANGSLKAVTVNLSALAGSTVWFAYRFSSDDSFNQEGMYIDDVRVTADSFGMCTTNVPPPGPAVAYRLSGLPSSTGAGDAATFTATAVDAVGQTAIAYSGSASFTSTDAQAVLPPTTAFTAGVASNLPISFRTLGTQSVTATDTGDPAFRGSTSTTVTPGAPKALKFTVEPSDNAAGESFSPTIRVGMVDQFGNEVVSGVNEITLALGANPGGGTLRGTTTVRAVNGVATFTDLNIDKVGVGYTLKASSPGLTGTTSAPFEIVPARPSKLVLQVQPVTTVAGVKMTPAVKVIILDEFNNVTDSTADVSLRLGTNTGNGVLSGRTSVSAVNGVATFIDLSINKVGTGYTLVADSPGLDPATSAGFNITPAAPYRVIITHQPSDVAAGAAITPPVEASVLDRFDNIATQATAPVSVALGSNPSGAVLHGTTTLVPVAGVATFDTLSLSKTGLNYTLVVGSSGLYSETSVGFDVGTSPTPIPAASFTLELPASVTAGEELTLSATARDADGSVAASYAGTVKVTSSDASATFASTATFAEGKLSNFKVTFKATGLKTITLTDSASSAVTGTAQTNVTPFAQPTAAVTSPSGGALVNGKVSITATGEVAAGTTLAKLAIFVDGTEIASGTDASVTGSWDSSKAQPGSHIITAVVTDGAGNTATSAPVLVSTEEGGCGCGATSGTDASIYLGLLVLARYALGRRRTQAV